MWIINIFLIPNRKKLRRYLLQHNLVSERQFGFRPHHTSGDILTIFSQQWLNALDRGNQIRLITLDIKGAFDKVWHHGLCSKFKGKGVTGSLLTWITSYLSNRSIRVIRSGQTSTPCAYQRLSP